MSAIDLAIALPVLATSGWLLYRSVARGARGGCHGCPSGGTCGKRPRGEDVGLVQLGSGRRR